MGKGIKVARGIMACFLLLLLMVARYYIANFQLKEFVVYIVFFLLLLILFFTKKVMICVPADIVGCIIIAFFLGSSVFAMVIPLFIFIVAIVFHESNSSKTCRKTIKTIQILEMVAVQPGWAGFCFFSKATGRSFPEAPITVLISCFVAFTIVLLWLFKLRTQSKRKKKDISDIQERIFHFRYLLITYCESVLLAVINHYLFFIIIVSDLFISIAVVYYFEIYKRADM